jgi:dihydrofolate reductase
MDTRRGIAVATGVPWKLPGDVAYFHEQTTEGLIVMGWVTYSEFRAPLHDRVNYVLTQRGEPLRGGFEGAADLDAVVEAHPDEDVWVIGGGAVFATTIGRAGELFITQVEGDFHCIKFFPPYTEDFTRYAQGEPRSEGGIGYRFERWRRRGPTTAGPLAPASS